MDAKALTRLYEYHIWANNQVWDCLESINAEQFTQDSEYSTGSLQKQLYHLMGTDAYAITMLNLEIPGGHLNEEDYVEMAPMRAKWDEIEATIKQGLANISDESLQAMIPVPTGDDDKTIEVPLWEGHASIINHGTNHRAQILMQLHKLGGKTVEQGLYFFMLQQ